MAFIHPYLAPTLKKEYGYNFTPLLGRRGFLWDEIKFLLLNKVKLKILDIGITTVAFKCVRVSSVSVVIVALDGRLEFEFPQGQRFVFSLLSRLLFRSSRSLFLFLVPRPLTTK